MTILWLKLIHILSSTLLFGTGLGTAYYLWRAHRGGDPKVIAAVARQVVLADWVFTTPSVIIQPLTGFWMVSLVGYSLSQTWLSVSLMLYVLMGACWLPVVWLQLRMRDLAEQAVSEETPLPPDYFRYFRCWFWLGWPAFIAVIIVFYLMVFKPF